MCVMATGCCLATLVGKMTSIDESWSLNVVMACLLSRGDF